jgi:hypothetical protein
MHRTTSDPKRRRIWVDVVRNSSSLPVANVLDTETDNDNEHRVTVGIEDMVPRTSTSADDEPSPSASGSVYMPTLVYDPTRQPSEGLQTQAQMQTESMPAYELVPYTKHVEDGDVTIPDLTNEIARLHEALYSKRSSKWELSKLISNIKHIKNRIVSLETKVGDRSWEPLQGTSSYPAFNYAAQLRHHGLRPDVNFAKRNWEARAPVSLSVKNGELSKELQQLRATVRELKASVADLVAIGQPGTQE